MTRQSHNPAPNVYLATYRDFQAIPGAPWVYWIPEDIRRLFRDLPKLGEVAQPRQGLATADNFRFLRFWWEVGVNRIAFDCRDRKGARATGARWFPYMKGGAYRKWYGNQEYVVNWKSDGEEMRAFTPRAVIRNPDYYFRNGVTWTDIGSKGFSARLNPGGFVFDVSGSCAFPETVDEIPLVLGTLNSPVARYSLSILNPTVHFQVGDLARLPIPNKISPEIKELTAATIYTEFAILTRNEPTFDFIAPPRWDSGLDDLTAAQARLRQLEAQIDEEVYRLYGISEEDRRAIEAELAGGVAVAEDEEDQEAAVGGNEEEEATAEAPITREELAVRWISYAMGIVLGRFQPGLPRTREPHRRGPLGRAIFHPDDFAVGSLPVPDADEFDALVGPAEGFAYVDEQGGRHLFSAEVEEKLRQMADPDGIMVLDEGHPDDLPARVEEALTLMLGEKGAREVMATVTGTKSPDRQKFRRFLERDFFRKHHLKMYRKRPIYWLLQTRNKNYGFYIYHERLDKDTLFKLQRDYIDPKLRLIDSRLAELRTRYQGAQGREKRLLEVEIDKLASLRLEIAEFQKAVQRVTDRGYDPDINDGVILNMAPLHELIPWKEPAQYWNELQQGRYDWAHMAMKYWPERVKEKCKKDKSLAIAHGLEV